MITICWIIGIILFIIDCFLAKQYNKWVRVNCSKWKEYIITKSITLIIGITSCLPLLGIIVNVIFTLIVIINWIYLKYKDRWDEPF